MRWLWGCALAHSLLATGCGGEEFSSAANTGSAGAASAPAVGCADGSVEAYTGEADIAACAGGFSLPGVVGDAMLTPSCNRMAGNDGMNSSGMGCTASDLCAAGWHVCSGPADILGKASNGACPASSGTTFWLTRQAENDANECAPGGVNNLVGCGAGLGRPAPPSCSPLDTELRYTDCQMLSSWRCGMSDQANLEATAVFKAGNSEGGVLCCSD